MSELEIAIAKGKLSMLAYLEGKQLFIAGRWRTNRAMTRIKILLAR